MRSRTRGVDSRTRRRVPSSTSSSVNSTSPSSSQSSSEPLARLDDEHGRAPLLAVVPAEDAVAALARVELDVVRKPLLELLGIGQGLPDLLGRRGEDDLARDFHGSSNPQPPGCVY